ncbi:MAG: autoinducer-2 kinase, partial [Campylobacterota bacterium]|nr:autoinducer-2 kinase [Campylobacterota bacterium]
AGIYENMVQASESLVEWAKIYTPNVENTAKYAEIKAQWEEVYAYQLKLVDRGLTQSMWKAPGV